MHKKSTNHQDLSLLRHVLHPHTPLHLKCEVHDAGLPDMGRLSYCGGYHCCPGAEEDVHIRKLYAGASYETNYQWKKFKTLLHEL